MHLKSGLIRGVGFGWRSYVRGGTTVFINDIYIDCTKYAYILALRQIWYL